MYCNSCGKKVEEGKKFCYNCGNKVTKEENDSYIIFERKNQFYGVLVPISIYLDGECVGKVKANSSRLELL